MASVRDKLFHPIPNLGDYRENIIHVLIVFRSRHADNQRLMTAYLTLKFLQKYYNFIFKQRFDNSLFKLIILGRHRSRPK